MFTILTDYGSYLVDRAQIDRLNTAKRAQAPTVSIDVRCSCLQHEHAIGNALTLRLLDVVGIIEHSGATRAPNVIPLRPSLQTA